MSLISQCCNTPPVQAEYTPIGEKFKLKEDLECYISGSKDSKQAIIYIYDIFCLHPNAYQGADILAKSGYRVILPDFLRNTPPSAEALGDGQKFGQWVKEKGSYEVLQSDFNAVKNYLVNVEKIDRVFLIGFCWGAKMVMELSAHDKFYLGGALVHPSLLDISDFENAQAPMIILPSQNERDFSKDYEVLTAKSFGPLCYQQRFDDMIHGWCAARGEWSDQKVAERANEAFRAVVSGFSKINSTA
ncbi:putative AIM2 family protein [Smittium mucronatum]|uniref:Putative AIM2 family protein n=1 Tax=Smittium mucronatum TaxID=133383 RepID=A0A1R0H5W6_9FUNG|nr:putative AIM2 family protein [Smittium mucronatum]